MLPVRDLLASVRAGVPPCHVPYTHASPCLTRASQLVLARALDDTAYLCYQYLKLEWTTGDALGGSNGLGGSPARAGYRWAAAAVVLFSVVECVNARLRVAGTSVDPLVGRTSAAC